MTDINWKTVLTVDENDERVDLGLVRQMARLQNSGLHLGMCGAEFNRKLSPSEMVSSFVLKMKAHSPCLGVMSPDLVSYYQGCGISPSDQRTIIPFSADVSDLSKFRESALNYVDNFYEILTNPVEVLDEHAARLLADYHYRFMPMRVPKFN